MEDSNTRKSYPIVVAGEQIESSNQIEDSQPLTDKDFGGPQSNMIVRTNQQTFDRNQQDFNFRQNDKDSSI